MKSGTFKDEIRCDFLVSQKRQEIWAKELEVFEVIKGICKKHQITYYLVAGSLLGAVRHKGYIPWDDDLDVAMFREDYNKFLKYAQKELPEELFLQTPYTDPGYYYGMAKIRINNTTGIRIRDWGCGLPFHQGIFVDIFPIDSVPDGKFMRKLHSKIAHIITRIPKNAVYYETEKSHSKAGKAVHSFCKLLIKIIPPIRFVALNEWWCKLYNKTNTQQVGLISEFYYNTHFIWNRSDFDNTIDTPIEYTTGTIPAGYENILAKNYGDWKTFVRNDSQHGEVFFDTEKSYKYYMLYYSKYQNIVSNGGLS